MNVKNQCRICLRQKFLISIFDNQNCTDLSIKIMSVAKINISRNDGLPATICAECLKKLNHCIEFIQLCKTTDTKLRASILNNKLLDNKSVNLNNDDNFYDFKYSPKSDVEGELLIDDNECSIHCEGSNDKVNKHEDCKDVKVLNEAESQNNKQCKKTVKQQCFTCGKVMSSGFRLKTHLRTHTGERPFSCPDCNKTFALEQNLKIHMRIHTGEKPLRCSICDASFAQSAGLAAHRRKHTGQMPYHCVLCPKSFRTIGHLQYHTRLHTGEKNFDCDMCGRAFITRSHLKHHLRTHTGDRPHVCCECGGRFTRASHLKRHTQRIHDGTTRSPEVAENKINIANMKLAKDPKVTKIVQAADE